MSVETAPFSPTPPAHGIAAHGNAAPARLTRLGDWLAAQLDREQGRWFLWLPVFFGAGIACYFALDFEPHGVLVVAAVLASFAFRILARASLFGLFASSILLSACLGFAAAKLRSWTVSGPIIERSAVYEVTGFIESADRISAGRNRVVLRLLSLELDGSAVPMPRRARISINGKVELRPGSAVKLRAKLYPPPGPAFPGAYDFGRAAYFAGIGASGFNVSRPEPATVEAVPVSAALSAWLTRQRNAIAERIQAVVPGQTGAIAAALIVGKRAELNENTLDAMRASGLAHVLSISGLHMTLVAGSFYWLMRLVLAAFQAIALQFPIRAWAAAAALGFATVYLGLSGSAIATQRSYLMIAVIFLAVMLNRPALSLRNIALAALAILAVMPESLLDASFQMSFAATAALVAAYESAGRYLRFEARGAGHALVLYPLIFLAGTLATTLVASTATAPFSAFHFNNAAPYSALGNLLAMPVVSVIVMPMAILTLAAMPLGLETLPLQAMSFGIEVMVWVAKLVAALDGSLIAVPAFPSYALALMVLGGLWLIIWRGQWRYAGIAIFAAGLAATASSSRPDLFVEREGKAIAVRGPDGRLVIPERTRRNYALGQFLRSDGDSREQKLAASGKAFQCDPTSCLISIRGRLIAHVLEPEAFALDCERASILVTPLFAPEGCRAPILIDRRTLTREGAHTIRFEGERTVLDTVARQRGDRPWSRGRIQRERIDPVASPDAPEPDADADGQQSSAQ